MRCFNTIDLISQSIPASYPLDDVEMIRSCTDLLVLFMSSRYYSMHNHIVCIFCERRSNRAPQFLMIRLQSFASSVGQCEPSKVARISGVMSSMFLSQLWWVALAPYSIFT